MTLLYRQIRQGTLWLLRFLYSALAYTLMQFPSDLSLGFDFPLKAMLFGALNWDLTLDNSLWTLQSIHLRKSTAEIKYTFTVWCVQLSHQNRPVYQVCSHKYLLSCTSLNGISLSSRCWERLSRANAKVQLNLYSRFNEIKWVDLVFRFQLSTRLIKKMYCFSALPISHLDGFC